MARNDVLAELGQAARSAAPDADAALDAALDRLLAQASADAAPEPGLRGLVHERLQHALAAGATGGAAAGDTAILESSAGLIPTANLAHTASAIHPVASAGVWARYGSKLFILVTGVAIGFVWGRAPSWQAQPPPASQTVSAVAAATTAPPSAERTLAPVAAAPEPTLEKESSLASASSAPPVAPEATPRAVREPTARRPTARSNAAPRPRAHAAKDTPENAESLRLVLEQLRKAQLFSRAGEHRRALAALDELDARVPLEVLQDEREVARTLALCDAGQEHAASALAARLIQRAPDSAYALSLRESCAGRAELLEQMRDRTSNPLP
jgi:hypothetical protein